MSRINDKMMDEVERFMMLFLSASMNQIADFSTFSANTLIELALKRENFKALLESGGEATLKEFQKALKRNEGFSSLRFEDSMTDDYLRFLNDRKVLYMALNDMENGTHCIVFRNRDLDKVNEIKNLVETIYYGKNEIDPKMFMEMNSEKEIGFTNASLTKEEIELARYFLKGKEVVFSVASGDKGKSVLLFNPEDRQVVQDAVYNADWMLRGNFGPKVKQQLEYRIKGRQNIVQNIQDAEKEFYIVSKNNPRNYMHVTEDQVTFYKNNKEIPGMTMSRDHKDFKAHVWDLYEGISSPVLLEPSEFFENIIKRQDVLNEKVTLDVFPGEMIVEEETRKYNKLRDLASYKMGLDNENQGDWALYVDSVPYTEFYGREEMLDDDYGKQKEYDSLQKSVKDSNDTHKFNQVTLHDKSLDAIISKARDKAEEQEKQIRDIERNR